MQFSDNESEASYFSCDDELYVDSSYFMKEKYLFFDSFSTLAPSHRTHETDSSLTVPPFGNTYDTGKLPSVPPSFRTCANSSLPSVPPSFRTCENDGLRTVPPPSYDTDSFSTVPPSFRAGKANDRFEDCPVFKEAFPLVLSSRNLAKSATTSELFKGTFPLLFSSLPSNLDTIGIESPSKPSPLAQLRSFPSLEFFRSNKKKGLGDNLQSVLHINEYSVSEDKCSVNVPIDSFREEFDTDNANSVSTALQVSEYSLKQQHTTMKEIPNELQTLFSDDSFQPDGNEPKILSKDEEKVLPSEENLVSTGVSETLPVSSPDESTANTPKLSSSSSSFSGLDGTGVQSCACQPVSWSIDFPNKKAKGHPVYLQQTVCSQWLLQEDKQDSDSYLPAVLDVDLKISSYKVLDLRRWFCMSRPQYSKSCGITSLVSVWNYLYSTIGTGNRNPITQEEALHLLGYRPPYGEIKFGSFTGNATLMKWFMKLNVHYGVKGKSYYMYKPKGRFATQWVTNDSALNSLKQGLAGTESAFIYHCLNHYFCPIGYEDTPQDPTRAYLGAPADLGLSSSNVDVRKTSIGSLSADSDKPAVETWVFIGEPSRKHPPIHCKRWTDILEDLHTESPYYYDIRRQDKGVFKRNTKKKGTNLHCIIAFHKG